MRRCRTLGGTHATHGAGYTLGGNLPRGRGGSPQSPNRLNRESRSRPDRVGRARTSRVPPEIEFHLRFIRHQKISNITPQNFIRTSLHQYASVEENPQSFVGAKLGHCENNRMDNDGTVGWDEDEDARRLRPPNRSGPCWCKAHCDARIFTLGTQRAAWDARGRVRRAAAFGRRERTRACEKSTNTSQREEVLGGLQRIQAYQERIQQDRGRRVASSQGRESRATE